MNPFLYVSIALFIVWCAVLLLSKKTRQEQLVMSVIGLALSPGAIMIASLDSVSSGRSLNGSVGIEDLLFAFAVFGLASVIYQVVLGKHAKKLRGDRIFLSHPATHWLAHLVIALGVWTCVALSLVVVLGLTASQSVVVGGLLVGTYVIADRKDLMFNALLSGVFVSALVFAAEQIFFVRMFPDAAPAFWSARHLGGLMLGGIPVEEIVWSGVVGFAIGPLYEYMREIKLGK